MQEECTNETLDNRGTTVSEDDTHEPEFHSRNKLEGTVEDTVEDKSTALDDEAVSYPIVPLVPAHLASSYRAY